ncbi:unnamed protein product [Penicillium egyptiacum]|uniref:Uncharacterized protein n=1 Tax=Penicillium egyptiacum TaxID=1303716 RepID=A0A9W4P5C4_9EURO|nr:unnamed protein product [Penicillium egyptiacum]
MHQRKNIQRDKKTAQQQSEKSAQKRPEQQKKFDYCRPYIVPNSDVQIIQADHPDMPIAIRVSDFLTDRGNPQDICPDGDWVNIANIKFEIQRKPRSGRLCGRRGHNLVRLTSFNLASTLLRTIRGTLAAKQPLNRPTVKMGGSTLVPNRRSEQVTRYAARRHANTKRKRAEAEAEARAEAGAETGEETGAETEAETDASPAQRRRVAVAQENPTTSSASPISDPILASASALELSPTGQEAQEGADGDAALLGLLDPASFNEAGLVGDDSGTLQEFFEQNEWARTDGGGLTREMGKEVSKVSQVNID